jgi:dTDP-4-amino-4,6-dideoxygalactose transaminase
LSFELKKNDLVWTSPISFVASANCALLANAKIDFVDIDPNTYNISTIELKNKLIKAKKNNKLPKLVIVVHLAGLPCDMHEIYLLSKKYKFKIIEDASHAINAYYKGLRVGNCKYSEITVFSFHAVKIITSGEGGIAITNNKKLAIKMQLLRSHGVTREKKLFQNKSINRWYYEQLLLGFNYRLTEFQAALVINQLKRVSKFTKKRNSISRLYDSLLKNLPIKLPVKLSDRISGMHLYIIQLDQKKISKKRDEIINYLHRKGIMVNLHYIPIHTQPYFKNLGFRLGDFPVAEEYYSNTLTLPMFPDLTIKQVKFIANEIKNAINSK